MPLGDELDLDQRDPRSGPHFHFPTPATEQCGEGSDPQGVQFRRADTEGGARGVAFGIGTTGKVSYEPGFGGEFTKILRIS